MSKLSRDLLVNSSINSDQLQVPVLNILVDTPNPIPSPFVPNYPKGSIAYGINDGLVVSNGLVWSAIATFTGSFDTEGQYIVYDGSSLVVGPYLGGGSSINFGENALKAGGAGTTNDIAIGSNALLTTTTGDNNVAIGSNSLKLATSGSSNIAIGSTALQTLTTGSGNVAIGDSIGLTLDTGSNNVVIGTGADVTSAAIEDAVIIGSGTTGAKQSVSIGPLASVTDATTGAISIGNASSAGANTSIAIGNAASGAGAASVAFGDIAVATGAASIAIGFDSAASNTNAVSIGQQSAAASEAVAVGSVAAAGKDTVAVGSGSVATSQYNVSVGRLADDGGKTGNVVLGGNITSGANNQVVIGAGITAVVGAGAATGSFLQVQVGATTYKLQLFAVA